MAEDGRTANAGTTGAAVQRGEPCTVGLEAVVDGVRLAAHTAFLQSSPMGVGLPERLAFRTIETWACSYPA
jgi:hypothetical protein